MMSFGRMISARAMAMRWRWPPENSWMYLPGVRGLEADVAERLADRVAAGGAARGVVEQVEGLGDEARRPGGAG